MTTIGNKTLSADELLADLHYQKVKSSYSAREIIYVNKDCGTKIVFDLTFRTVELFSFVEVADQLCQLSIKANTEELIAIVQKEKELGWVQCI